MGTTYVIADLHGHFDLFSQAMHAIMERHPEGPKDVKIVLLGDYVDRGPKSMEIISTFIEISEHPVMRRFVCLKGNHEDMMVLALTKGAHRPWTQGMDHWLTNGGTQTLLSYGVTDFEHLSDLDKVPKEHISWLYGLPVWYEDKHRIYVHAWVDPSIPMDKQKDDRMMWEMWNHNTDAPHRPTGKHIVHGHHFHKKPLLLKNRTNLDTNCWYTGVLHIGVFDDDKPGGPIEVLEVVGEPSKGRAMN